ncbi:MAG TPA: potassium-transporting ATPase subunit C, partial [Solirubrobacteraceae bacterium]
MKRDLITSAIGIVVLTLFLGVLYPLVVTGVGQLAFPGNANGQKVYVDGKLVGSKIIGQQFQLQVVKNGKPQVDKNGNPV